MSGNCVIHGNVWCSCPPPTKRIVPTGRMTGEMIDKELERIRKRKKARAEIVPLTQCPNCHEWMVPPDGRCIQCGVGPKVGGGENC